MTNAVETTDLSHRFAGSDYAIQDVDLVVPAGSIYGFLGANGAGKTTTLRLLLGLLRKQQGTIRVFGKELNQDRLGILRRIGSLIESPSLYGHLSATENLRIWQGLYRCPAQRIGEALDLVGLKRTGSKPTSHFSLGMKQRLGLAIALLHKPLLLLLDEPTNGLDPEGIIEIRTLLDGLARSGEVTVVISSHLLAEVEKLVTDVGVLHQGRLVFQGTLAALSAGAHAASVIFHTDDNPRGSAILSEAGWAVRLDQDTLVVATDVANSAALNATLVNAGIGVFEITPSRRDLEAVFMELIRGKP